MNIGKTFPNNWKIKKMPEVVTWSSGGTPKATEQAYYKDGTIPWLIIRDLNDSVINTSLSKITDLGLKNSSAKMIPVGTLLVAMYGSIGKLGITGIECCTNQAIAFAKELHGVITKYMFYYMSFIKPKLISMGKGGTQKNISQSVLNSLNVVVPPLSEQERIVARIEELFSELDKSVETLKTIKQQFAAYRQAVLKEAFEGTYGFEFAPIQFVCSNIVDCPHSTPKWRREGEICLRTTNFRRGYLDLSEKNYVTKETFNSRNTRLVPLPGDVLYSREGAILGIACIIPENLSVCLGQRMMLMRTNEKMIGRFLMHYLNSPKVTAFVSSKIGGSASPHINVGDIKNFAIPVPPISKQEQIVKQIELHMSVCDQIEKAVEQSLQQAEVMRRSILKQAFEGKMI